MPIKRRNFRSMTVNLSGFDIKKQIITIAISIVFILVLVGITFTSVESLTSEANEQSRVEQLVSKIRTATYKQILQHEMKVLNATETSTHSNRTTYEFGAFLSKLFTGIEIYNLQSILHQEVPGYSVMAMELIGDRNQLDIYAPPVETPPPDNLFSNEKEDNEDQKPEPPKKPKQEPTKPKVNYTEKPPVLIYHTHNREAFLPELKNIKKANEAYHPTNNITLVGKHLAENLEKLGVPTILSSKDYWVDLPPGEYWKSYVHSKKEVEAILKQHKYIPFILDIHRDSALRARTTVTHSGKDYAAVWFIIGQINPTWQYNYQFAATIEGRLEAKVPGISRGIWAKKSGQYNQDISHNSVLIEIGGVDNNFEEANRTAEVLAKIIADLYEDMVIQGQ
ncbi:hypothetical protein BHU72_11365 [Desulfuribacillus stibiiarsenatis]|uniref:Stage II sporulation protein P n=1 Tax=Desulfuribacillus stibiiarsenatis TaxID=1390249 RepID=A0A1E5L7J4_9FIRM|nr:stage II sporulation protein P [Desulfuribacillus stibiiarsenatis]OEH86132.1 hypothetical protein BHU72_11365 [Desulfuribacillus stibiiarsenatis]